MRGAASTDVYNALVLRVAVAVEGRTLETRMQQPAAQGPWLVVWILLALFSPFSRAG